MCFHSKFNDNGSTFCCLIKIKGEKKMNTDDKIKVVLSKINDETFDVNNTLPNESREELKKIILMSEREGFITHESSKQKLLINFMGGGFDINSTTYLTRSGRQFLEDYDRTKSQVSQTFNIGSVANSAIGNYNTVNNYSETPIQDLKELVQSLNNDDVLKDEGKELIKTLETEDVKPGYLAKFEDFLKKYPKSVELVSSFVTSIAIGAITQ